MDNRVCRWRRGAPAALLVISVLGCARTRMTSQPNPELAGRHFTTVLVHGIFQSLEDRRLAEAKLCAELSRVAACECLKSSEVFFPGQEYSPEEVANRLTKLRVDAVLGLRPTGSGITSTYVPGTTYTTSTAHVSGNTITASSTTKTSGGYNFRKPWADYEAVLWSTTDGKVAWYATAESKGSAFAGRDDLIQSASSKVVSKLLADGVFR